jgi:hypothetical protein
MTEKSSSRKQSKEPNPRELDVEITFLEGLIRRDPGYVDALQVLGDDYTQRGRFEEGLQVDQKLAEPSRASWTRPRGRWNPRSTWATAISNGWRAIRTSRRCASTPNTPGCARRSAG